MNAMASGALAELCTHNEDSIEPQADLSAHESKCWRVARAALAEATLSGTLRYDRAIPAYIAGYSVMFMHSSD